MRLINKIIEFEITLEVDVVEDSAKKEENASLMI